MLIWERLKQKARKLKAETYALYLAARDPRTPWYAKLLVAGIVAYAFSPIDLIPDFIPVIGYLDDIILVPLGIILALKLIPSAVMTDCRTRAKETMQNGKPVSKAAAVVIIIIWMLLAGVCGMWIYDVINQWK